MQISEMIRPELRALKPYEVGPEKSREWLILDGNENPYPLPEPVVREITERIGTLALNRYPDTTCRHLRGKIADYLAISPEEILVGNGSDEMLQALIKAFIGPGDRVAALAPTFSMYQIFTEMQGGTYVSIALDEEGRLGQEVLKEALLHHAPKMLILCSPNNPSGTRIPLPVLREIAGSYQGILVVDEAYAEFCSGSMIPAVSEYPHLVVTRTFSKAFGLAGVRLGYLIGSVPLVREVSKVLMPYHLNSLSQLCGEILLDYLPLIEERVKLICAERERLRAEFVTAPGLRVYPSEANFLFLQGPEVQKLALMLDAAAIKVRKFSGALQNSLRLTVGKPEENDAVLRVLREFLRDRAGEERSIHHGTDSRN